MTGRGAWVCALLATLAACGERAKVDRPQGDAELPPAQRDAEALGQAVFEMVDRAMDYRGSHRGRPAASLRQLGVDSLTPTMVRRLINVNREPVITVAFRQPQAHEIISCRGDAQILEESALNGGRFTLMCTTNSGAQRPIQVGAGVSP